MTSADIIVPFQFLSNGEGLKPPSRATANSAGYDIASAEDVTLEPGAVLAVATGFALAIPEGFEGQVRPRSGLALKHGVTVLNAPGTIDADYRGEVKIILINHGKQAFRIGRNDRIAQLIIAPVTSAVFERVRELSSSARGSGGFGSTGTSNTEKD
ncbi:MAG: dUTP diphosphatase [Micropepsaceae bacterium]